MFSLKLHFLQLKKLIMMSLGLGGFLRKTFFFLFFNISFTFFPVYLWICVCVHSYTFVCITVKYPLDKITLENTRSQVFC